MLNMVKMRGLGVGLAAVRRAEAEADERDEASERTPAVMYALIFEFFFFLSGAPKGWATQLTIV